MALHTKYRPKTLDKLIGQTTAVTRLKGIINSGKVPSAMLFTGPTSVGKTTLARAFACDLSGKGETFLNSPDYKEINFSDTRGIDDIRELIRITRFKPQMSKYRVIVGDECQGLLSTPAAANCIEANTYIITDKGAKKAKDIFAQLEQGKKFKFLSYNTQTGNLELQACVAWAAKTTTEDCYVLAESGAKVTANHPVAVISDDSMPEIPNAKLNVKWVKASKLKNRHTLVFSTIGNTKSNLDFSEGECVKTKADQNRTVYDFEVQSNNNFFVSGDPRMFSLWTLVHNCMLKGLEESQNTVWILCSMNPEKFQTTTIGKAIANRCVQFNLEPPSNVELLKQAKRICKGERMDYMLDEECKLLKTIVKNSNYEMRTLAQLVEACQQYYEGLAEKPEQLSLKDISSVLSSVESSEDQLAQKFITGLYALQFSVCQRCILDSNDHIGLLNKLSFINSYLVNSTILGSEKHRKVWNTAANVQVKKQIEKLKITLGMLAEVNTRLVECKAQAMQFGVGADTLLSAFAYSTIRKLQEMQK